ncbi:MAG: ImmA/IrrE family metallo-endopeptidase, partial [Ignavibacteriales bacterium]
MASRREEIHHGKKEAARLHRDLGIRSKIEGRGGRVDVFGAILDLDLPLLFRPLKGLLGAYLPGPYPGIMVTNQRPLQIQRFTGAHELGHAVMKHEGSLDDESILHRSPFGRASYNFVELAADAFASAFLTPRWLLETHAALQGWDR